MQGVAYSPPNSYVTRVRVSDRTIVGSTIPVESAGALPDAMVFDGVNVWVVNNLGNSVNKR